MVFSRLFQSFFLYFHSDKKWESPAEKVPGFIFLVPGKERRPFMLLFPPRGRRDRERRKNVRIYRKKRKGTKQEQWP